MQFPLIVGAGMTAFGKAPDKSLADLAGAAVQAALADAGIERGEVEAVFAANSVAGVITGQEAIRGQVSLKAAGIGGVPIINVENACASGSTALHMACAYIAAGVARVVLVAGYEKMVHTDRAVPFRALEACSDIEELAALKAALGPDGANRSIFMDYYADKVNQYFARTGASARHLAWIAAKNHSNGALNPLAQFRNPQTTESVLASRGVVAPLTLLMCSPISDGAAALVVVDADWARARGKSGPQVRASVLRSESYATAGSQARDCAMMAYAKAGIVAQDIDVAEVHDATAAGELFGIEDIGLAAPDQGWKLVEEGATALGGRVPVNPSGGLLARGHPIGATGVAQVVELTWQLRGSAGARQVANATVAVAQTAGGQASFGKTTGAAAMSVTVLAA